MAGTFYQEIKAGSPSVSKRNPRPRPPRPRSRPADGITVAEILKYCQSQRHSPDTILSQCCCGFCKAANLIKCAQKDAERRRKP